MFSSLGTQRNMACNKSLRESVSGAQLLYTWVSQKKFTRLVGCEIKSMCPIVKTKISIYQSTANLDEKILFGKIARL